MSYDVAIQSLEETMSDVVNSHKTACERVVYLTDQIAKLTAELEIERDEVSECESVMLQLQSAMRLLDPEYTENRYGYTG